MVVLTDIFVGLKTNVEGQRVRNPLLPFNFGWFWTVGSFAIEALSSRF